MSIEAIEEKLESPQRPKQARMQLDNFWEKIKMGV